MKLQIPETSKSLIEIAWDRKKEIFEDKEYGKFNVLIENSWNTILYLENWEEASVDEGFPLRQWGNLSFNYLFLNRINIISEWWPWEIRMFISSN